MMSKIMLFLGVACLSLSVNAGVSVSFNKQAASQTCVNESTKRGELDQRSYSYCYGRQERNYYRLLGLIKRHQKGGEKEVLHFNDVVRLALEDWGKPHKYKMATVAYTVETESESYLDAMYRMKSEGLSEGMLKRCMNKWLPKWSMVDYCLKKGR